MATISIIILVSLFSNAIYTLELSKWTIINNNGTIKLNDISSPVDVYSALFQSSIIDWPLNGYNDVKYRWIAQDNWTFISQPFSIDQSKSISLFVSGLDINPLIYLNDRFIGTTVSEFVSLDIPIDASIVHKSNNILRLVFYSPMLLANRTSISTNYSIPPECWPEEYHGECHVNFIRKTQSSFGWDWGPAIPTVGIRGRIKLHATSTILAEIRSVKLLTNANENCTIWSAEVEIISHVIYVEFQTEICAIVKIRNLFSGLIGCAVIRENGLFRIKIKLPIDQHFPKLWWPYEMGTPTLYQLEVSLINTKHVIDSKSVYVGFRSISLNQTIISNENGRYFGFYVNCRRFFVKGTNWVPRTYLTADWNNVSMIEFLLDSVKNANMNSLRLWGGGKPEHDHFYSVADKLGLMVWHDLLFACALYPDNDEFVTVVQQEVTEIVGKLQYHPCILTWSGNNEIEVLIAQGWYNTKPMDADNIKRYYHLFGVIIKSTVLAEDPFTPFILSSPSNGDESVKNQGVSAYPQNPLFGDVHFYLYNGDLWNESLYPVTRMTTEFGFQSLPALETWSHVTKSEADLEINGPLMRHLQHHPDGNRQLIEAIRFFFGKLFPINTRTDAEKYRWFSYLTQINQAYIYKMYINKLRSHQCTLTPDGKGLTQGAMFWQLNDNWIAPTWSTIDYMFSWKLAHYFVKQSFSPEQVNVVIINNVVSIAVILPDRFLIEKFRILMVGRDLTKNIHSSVTGNKSISFSTLEFQCNVKTILVMKDMEFMKTLNCSNDSSCLFEVTLLKNEQVVSKDTIIMARPKDMIIPAVVANDQLSVKIERDDPDYSLCRVTLQCEYIHFYVFLTTNSLGSFSDNGMQITNETTIVKFNPWYIDKNQFFDCFSLKINVLSLNTLYI